MAAATVVQINGTPPGGMEISSAPGNLQGRTVLTRAQLDGLADHCRDEAELSKSSMIISIIALVIIVAAGITAIVALGAFAGPLPAMIGLPILSLVVIPGIFLIGALSADSQKYKDVENALREDTAFIEFVQNQNANEDNILKIYETFQSRIVDRFKYEYGIDDSLTFYEGPRF